MKVPEVCYLILFMRLAMIGNSYKIVSMMDDLFYKLFEIPFDEVIA